MLVLLGAGAGCAGLSSATPEAPTATAPEARVTAAPAATAPEAPGAAAHPLPAVALRTLDDQAMRLEVLAGGKPALVTFWATWCDACTAEMDALNRLDDRLRRSGGMVIGVAVGETREKAADLVHRRGLRYAQLVDEQLALADALGQKRLPATLVLDRKGRVVFTGGALDERALLALRAALTEP
jgi:peroxiredoxin